MNRARRRLLKAQSRKANVQEEMRGLAQTYPAVLTLVPEREWPLGPSEGRPDAVWRSREFLVQAYSGADMIRLTCIRVTLQQDGQWEQDITWEELQRIKRECGFGDSYAVEVYPREKDVVRDCNMRHLWVLPHPLAIGWVRA